MLSRILGKKDGFIQLEADDVEHVSGLWGDTSKLIGIKSKLTGTVHAKGLQCLVSGDSDILSGDISNIYGSTIFIFGKIGNLTGDISGFNGDVSGITGKIHENGLRIHTHYGEVMFSNLLTGNVSKIFARNNRNVPAKQNVLSGKISEKLHGDLSGICGDLTGLTGDPSNFRLHEKPYTSYGFMSASVDVYTRDVTKFKGDVTGIYDDVRQDINFGLFGSVDFDTLGISDEQRVSGYPLSKCVQKYIDMD